MQYLILTQLRKCFSAKFMLKVNANFIQNVYFRKLPFSSSVWNCFSENNRNKPTFFTTFESPELLVKVLVVKSWGSVNSSGSFATWTLIEPKQKSNNKTKLPCALRQTSSLDRQRFSLSLCVCCLRVNDDIRTYLSSIRAGGAPAAMTSPPHLTHFDAKSLWVRVNETPEGHMLCLTHVHAAAETISFSLAAESHEAGLKLILWCLPIVTWSSSFLYKQKYVDASALLLGENCQHTYRLCDIW